MYQNTLYVLILLFLSIILGACTLSTPSIPTDTGSLSIDSISTGTVDSGVIYTQTGELVDIYTTGVYATGYTVDDSLEQIEKISQQM
jgi:hypothetical protein